MPDPEPETRALLRAACDGDRSAEQRLMERFGGELRELAEQHLRRQPADATLQPTALMNEAWLGFARRAELDFDNRHAFLGFASRVMRNLLVDRARARAADKRGGGRQRVSLDPERLEADAPEHGLLDVEGALERLEAEDAETARLVELRFYGGLSHAEAAEVLGLSRRQVERRWLYARAWLQDALGSERP